MADAKAHSSALVEQARNEPQTITRRGLATAVVASAEEWERRCPREGRLVDFFANSPLRGSGLEIEPRTADTSVLDL